MGEVDGEELEEMKLMNNMKCVETLKQLEELQTPSLVFISIFQILTFSSLAFYLEYSGSFMWKKRNCE